MKAVMAEMGGGANLMVSFSKCCSFRNNTLYTVYSVQYTCVRLQILQNDSALYRIKNRQHRVHTVNNNIIIFFIRVSVTVY
jgi:hypothetical protein